MCINIHIYTLYYNDVVYHAFFRYANPWILSVCKQYFITDCKNRF